MSDGLLDTRSQRARRLAVRTGLGTAPSLLLALAFLALGGGVVGVAVAIVGALLGLSIGTSARTDRGAAVAGVVVAAALFLLQIVLAWIASHPILPGD
jgi:hypothetical protein